MLRVINGRWTGVELGNSNHPDHRGADGTKVPLMPGSSQHCERSVMHVRGSQASRTTLQWNRHASFPYPEPPFSTLSSGTGASLSCKTAPDHPLVARFLSCRPSGTGHPILCRRHPNSRIRPQISRRSSSLSACLRIWTGSPRTSASAYHRHPSSIRPKRMR
jgi:hypothetical protein